MIQGVEDLRLDGIEERELRLIQRLEIRVVERSDTDRPKRQQFGMRIVLCRHRDIRQIDLHIEVQVKPSIRDQLARVVIALSDTVLPSWDLVREEERDLNAVLVLDAS